MTCSIPWPCVVALRLEPVGAIKADCFGLRWVEGNTFHIAESRRVAQLREALGSLVHDPRVNQVPFNPERHPFYTLLCEVHNVLQEEV